MGNRRGLAGLRDPRVVTTFDRIIRASYTPQEIFALRKIQARHWLALLERGDTESKAKARAFWNGLRKP